MGITYFTIFFQLNFKDFFTNGIFLFRLADAMRQAFVDMAACENTSIVALACGVVNLFDSFCEFIGGYVVAKWKMLTAVAVVFAVAHISIVIDPVQTVKLLLLTSP